MNSRLMLQSEPVMDLQIILLINRLIVWFIKIQKIVRNAVTITQSPK